MKNITNKEIFNLLQSTLEGSNNKNSLKNLKNKDIFSLREEIGMELDRREDYLMNCFFENKSLPKLRRASFYYKGDDTYKIIENVLDVTEFNENDIKFIKYLTDEENFTFSEKNLNFLFEKIFKNSFRNPVFFDKLKESFEEKLNIFLINQFDKDSLSFADVSVIDYFLKKNPREIKSKNIGDYVDMDRVDVITWILDNPNMSGKIFDSEIKTDIWACKAANKKSWNCLEFFTDKFNSKKSAELIFSSDENAKSFFVNLDYDFDYKFFNKYEFTQKALMHAIYSMRDLKDLNDCREFIDILVKRHKEDADFVEQVKRKIDISTALSFKEIAANQFKISYLELSLKEKDVVKKNKI